METINNCIIQPVNDQYSIFYSYITGKFYLCNVSCLSVVVKEAGDEHRKKFVLDDRVLCEIAKCAVNPNLVDISIFKSPLVIGIMATNQCNLSCRYCIATNGNVYSEKNIFLKKSFHLIKKLQNSRAISIMISGGEPTLCENLSVFLSDIAAQNFLCLLDTNGVAISNTAIEVLATTDIIPRVSLDSIDEAEHNYNRGNFKATISNIKLMLEKKTKLRINTVLNSTNINNITRLADWLIQNGITKWHIFKVQKEFAPHDLWISDTEAEATVAFLYKTYGKKLDILCKFSHTNDGFASFIVDGEGNCFSSNNTMSSSKVCFGNLYNSDISDIWLNTPFDYRLRHYNKHLTYAGKLT